MTLWKRIQKFFGIDVCEHRWQETLIFCGQPNTHRVVKSCWRCGKSHIIFEGNRREWYEFSGMLDVYKRDLKEGI